MRVLSYTVGLFIVLFSNSVMSETKKTGNKALNTNIEKLSVEEYRKKKIELLMERARQSMVKNEYRSAISNYTKVVNTQGTVFFRAALEYLGLARERNQQYAHAKAEYERYLRLFPQGEGADRVRQRLSGLITAAFEPKKKLRKLKRKKNRSSWQNYGGFLQSYRRDMSLDNNTGDNLLLSRAYSSFYYRSHIRTLNYKMTNRISVNNSFDFDTADKDNEQAKFANLYSEIYFKRAKLLSRLGRQTQSSSGAYGRFDGAVLAWNYNQRVVLRGITGFPVEYDSYDRIQKNKRFYSANLEIESFNGYFDFNSYFISQYFDNVLDRRALGLELRHLDKKTTLFAIVDYDFSYGLVNSATFNVSYKIKPNHTLATYLIFRHSPLVSTTNALQGQSASSLDKLTEGKTKSEIRRLAKDRSANYYSANISWRHKWQEKFQINYDYTLSNLSGTSPSGGVTGTSGTGYEHYFSSQIIANGLLKKYDMSILALRYDIRSTSKRTSLSAIQRSRVDRKISISSKFRFDYQQRLDGELIYDIRPSIKTNYSLSRRIKVDAEIGVQQRIRRNSFDEEKLSGFFSLGYISQF